VKESNSVCSGFLTHHLKPHPLTPSPTIFYVEIVALIGWRGGIKKEGSLYCSLLRKVVYYERRKGAAGCEKGNGIPRPRR
jgi:hypothetical protein